MLKTVFLYSLSNPHSHATKMLAPLMTLLLIANFPQQLNSKE
jgi:hypothetical protein